MVADAMEATFAGAYPIDSNRHGTARDYRVLETGDLNGDTVRRGTSGNGLYRFQIPVSRQSGSWVSLCGGNQPTEM